MYKSKKLISLSLCLLLVLSMFLGNIPSIEASDTAQFEDINAHWAQDRIVQWIEKGLIKGYEDGSFKPDKSITRAEFITIVNKAFGFKDIGSSSFSDVSNSDWYAEGIKRAAAEGYVNGYEDGTIRPNNKISRQEVAAILYKVLKIDAEENNRILSKFTDIGEIPEWSRSYISAVVEAGYMDGYPDGTCRPSNSITRAESVTILHRAAGALYNTKGVYGPESGVKDIAGNATIGDADITLKNLNIRGDLYITSGVGEGEITLDNVTVKGKTIVCGGGMNSIYLKKFSGGKLQVLKRNVRIATLEDTKIDKVIFKSGGHLEGKGVSEVYISEPNENITLDGEFEKVVVEARVNLQIAGDTTIDKMEIAKKADKTEINLSNKSTIKELTLNSSTEVLGKGKIEKADIRVDGVIIEKRPDKVALKDGVSAKIDGKKLSEGKDSDKSSGRRSSRRSSGGGGGGSDKPTVIKVNSVALSKNTVTLAVYGSVYNREETITATIDPEDATNQKVTWSSSDENVATVSGDGLEATVKAIGEGKTIITVKTDDGDKTATCEVTVIKGSEEPEEVNKLELEAKVEEAKELVEIEYTKETWKVFAEALKIAKEVLAGEDATQEEVDKALETLEKAIDSLEKEPLEPKPTEYTVTVVTKNGTVEGTGKYREGEKVTLIAKADKGYEFKNWTNEKGEEISKENPYTFTMGTEDVTLLANFKAKEVEPDTYKVTFDVKPEDAIVVVKDSKGNVVKAEEDGTYKLEAGEYSYEVSAKGYVTKTGEITVSNKDETVIGVELKKEEIKVNSVALSKNTVTLAVYGSVYNREETITATIDPEDATNQKVTWSSSDENVATVTGDGLKATVKAIGEGKTIITVKTDDGDKTATCEVTVIKGSEEPEPIKANLKSTNRVGIAPDTAGEAAGKIYAEYKLVTGDDEEISLSKDNVEYIKVKVGEEDWKELIANTDNNLWFNVEKVAGTHEFEVKTKKGEIYTATLNWKAEIKTATLVSTGREGDHEGKTYVEYKLMDGENQVSLKEDNVKLMAQKEEAKWINLEQNTDETLWFNKAKETGKYDFFVVTSEGIMYKATLDWEKEPVDEIDKTALKAKVEEVASLVKEDYTAETWAALQTALGAANTVIDNEDATQEEIDIALANLLVAIEALVKAEVLEAPAHGLKELDVPGLTLDNVRYLAFGLNNEAGSAQKVATLDEVKEFIDEKYNVTFNTKAIKIEEGKLSIDGSVLSKADWRKVKADGDKTIPYRITVLKSDKANKVAKIAMYEDGKAVIEDLQEPETTIYTVTFDSKGGSDVAAITVEDGKAVELPGEPTRDGYIFMGWFTDEEYTTEFTAETQVTSDITVYAKWTINHIADVANVEEFKVALENENKTIINLTADFKTTEKILVNREVTVNGNNKVITFTGDTEGWQGNYVIHVYKIAGVTIKDIKLTGGDAALYVNGSEVTLEGNVDITGNEFGGIEVSQGKNVTNVPKLLVNGTITYQSPDSGIKPVIWIDGKRTNDGWVVAEGLYEEVAGSNPADGGEQYYFFDKGEYAHEAVKAALDEVNAITGTVDDIEVIKKNAGILGLDLTQFNALDDKTGQAGGRQTAVMKDIASNRPDTGYDQVTLKETFDSIVAVRTATQASMNLVNDATELKDIAYVENLLAAFKAAKHATHSGKQVSDKIAELESLVTRYKALSEADQKTVLEEVIANKPEGGYRRSQSTLDVLNAEISEQEGGKDN